MALFIYLCDCFACRSISILYICDWFPRLSGSEAFGGSWNNGAHFVGERAAGLRISVACLERTGWSTYRTSLKFNKLIVVQHTIFVKSFRNYPGLS